MKKVLVAVMIFALSLAMFVPVFGKGGNNAEKDDAGNNLSYPVIAVNDFLIAENDTTSFTEPFNPALYDSEDADVEYLNTNGYVVTQEDIDNWTPLDFALTVGQKVWFAQKVEGNTWQADFVKVEDDIDVDEIDWGDVIEVVNPMVKTPMRIELTFYKNLDPATDDPMYGYEMAMLANPSSKDEIQGTNTNDQVVCYSPTVISDSPKLVIQYFGTDLEEDNPVTVLEENGIEEDWAATMWVGVEPEPAVIFGPELNVGGKYIYGAAQGGWKPDQPGWYRITVYIPEYYTPKPSEENKDPSEIPTQIKLTYATIRPIEEEEETSEEVTISEGDEQGKEPMGATPVIDTVNNLTYVDVWVEEAESNSKKPDKD